MEVAIIILGAFVALLVIVIFCLGIRIKEKDEKIHDLYLDLDDYVFQAKEDAKTICALRKEIESLKTE